MSIKEMIQEKNLQLSVGRKENYVELSNFNKKLKYIVLSTQPGRGIQYPPTCKKDKLYFILKKSQGISIESEAFCAIGLQQNSTKIADYKQSKAIKKAMQRNLYMSKIHILVRNKFIPSEQQSQKKPSTLVHPPQVLSEQNVQQLLKKMNYGQLVKLETKKNCFIFSFKQDVQIKDSFIIHKIQQKTQYISIIYWAITNHRTFYTYQPNQIFSFPKDTHIRFFQVSAGWLIAATDKEVVFIHLYRPKQNYLHVPCQKFESICTSNDKVLIFEHKTVSIYKLNQNTIEPQVIRIRTRKIACFTGCFKKQTAIFGGINYSIAFNQPIKQKSIYIINNFTSTQKEYRADRLLQIGKKDEWIPIRNIKYIKKINLFICSCGQSVYLFHLQSNQLISAVDLSSTINKIFQIDYPINIVNVLVKAKNQKNLIRISFEQYGEIFGTEVTNIQKYGEPQDFYAENTKVYTVQGKRILLYNDHQKNQVLYQTESQHCKLRYISKYQGNFVFLLQKQNHVFQAFFKEL